MDQFSCVAAYGVPWWKKPSKSRKTGKTRKKFPERSFLKNTIWRPKRWYFDATRRALSDQTGKLAIQEWYDQKRWPESEKKGQLWGPLGKSPTKKVPRKSQFFG